ncbi:NUMOD3 domain-containing DNA-binding protein [Chryseolinea sp. T2]|uniref:NUMOD3 domain-containing DNA-binding protein n=1 Tax=Chryseolinea sp. T2 TaxID=3129255 RepID=UPI003077BE46
MRVFTKKHREKLRQAKLGHKQSAETIEKRVSKMRGKNNPNYGKVYTLAERIEMSIEMTDKTLGSDHVNAKLDEERVSIIWKLLNETQLSQSYIGELFNVSRSTIKNIKAGILWTHVTGLERNYNYVKDSLK